MTGSYNLTLVFASYCVAVIAAYTAIYFGTRLFTLQGSSRKFWLGAGAVCLGSGIWSMHFVGMSAYSMPHDMTMSFSLPLTIASWIPAVAASALALLVITREQVAFRGIAASAVIMGAGISAMHYGGMWAMKMEPGIVYDQTIVAISIAIAVAASGAALVICRQVRVVPARYALLTKTVAALVMGAAICGMHYTGMAAASYPMNAAMSADNALRGDWMGIPTAIAAGGFLLIALIVAYQDFRQAELERQQRVQQAQKVQDDAFRDPVTGLGNRSDLDRQVMALLADDSTKSGFSVICLDIAQFREHALASSGETTNDVVRELANVLAAVVPNAHSVGRLGSSGFAALLPRLDESEELALAKQLKAAMQHSAQIRRFSPFTLGVSHYPTSATNSRLLFREAQRPKYTLSWSQPAIAEAEPA
ncbi:MHYT domain-containing protein [Gilvimarinus sp. SDUM040013]|uniref:MHYT domain-containing protein n=1 Tax=Gilvimarinus gilvus TaxID=3058038 RepID=A0ABU4RT11_9GAMM|nr:MHYT domain-containing protein [Gilvimarinus sp. SDUM040013]MDO3387079.1 MHYT domain-containing protein [Gilvimarinus sp. SDUM040013]MDX6848026.1 MHYT domain-containing protein [Gilvimarinus sp. SDUM040013]